MANGVKKSVGLVIIRAILHLLCFLIHIVLLIKELKKRKSKSIIFVTRFLKVGPLLCMFSGAFLSLVSIFADINGLCYVVPWLVMTAATMQMVMMGLYQLSRLKYCFSQSKVHSKHGYPFLLFIIMYTFGICWFLAINICNGIFRTFVIIYCGFDGKSFVFVPSHTSKSILVNSILGMSGLFWDITTLLLYIMKRISFNVIKSKDINVHKRIMSVLDRILILTLFYEIFFLGANIMNSFDKIKEKQMAQPIFNISAVTINYSMFLMQQHNTNEYKYFLKLLYKLKIHYICFCVKSTIIYELTADKSESQMDVVNKDNNNSSTKYDTTTEPVKIDHSSINQLSQESTATSVGI